MVHPQRTTKSFKFTIMALLYVVITLLLIPFIQIAVAVLPVIFFARYFCLRRRADLILDYLYRTVRLGHPLASSLAAAGNTERGALGRRLTVLSEMLQQGKTLGQALPLAVPEVRASDAAAIAAAEESGNLLSALKRMLAAKSTWDFSNELNVSYGVYLLFLVTAIILIPSFFIAHSLRVYVQYHLPLPEMDIIFWSFYTKIQNYFEPALPFIPIVLFFILLCAMVILLTRIFFPVYKRVRRFVTLGDLLAWYTPFFCAIVRWRTWANVTAILHEYALAGGELTSAVESAANSGINSIARWRLLRWKKRMEKGQSPKAAALTVGLPRLLCSNLDEATGSTFAGSLGFIHAIYQRRYEQAASLVRGALIPTAVIFLGFIVLITMLLMYLPYATLMNVMESGGLR